jgi:carotenoid cleavage dioxygenase-like enzyme
MVDRISTSHATSDRGAFRSAGSGTRPSAAAMRQPVNTGPAPLGFRRHDVRNARTEVHDFGPGCATLEPIFVPRAGATEEDDGYVISYVFNAARNASEVVILSAQDFSGAPLAVVELPVCVPVGFHGVWIPDRA